MSADRGPLAARQFFCKVCGNYPFHRKRVTPDSFGINVGINVDMLMTIAYVNTYLEMNSQSEFIEKKHSNGLEVKETETKDFKLNRYLYCLVGEQWGWTEKLSLSDEQWKEYAEADNLRTWVACYKGATAGYFELQTGLDFTVEIAFFGLAPGFIGQGFGAYLLSCAIKSAWEKCNARRVWVYTCTSDHPNALGNYQSCGLKIYHKETCY